MLWALTVVGLVGLLGVCRAAFSASAPSTPEPRPDTRPLVYVALGASDGVGVGSQSPETDGWVPRMAARLGPRTRLLNLGVSGSLLRDAVDEQLPVALEAEPDVVTIWLVVNDFRHAVPLERYEKDFDWLLKQLREQTHARLVVGNVPDLSLLEAQEDVDPVLLRREVACWNEAIVATAARHDARVADLHSYWHELAAHPEYVSEDGFHPSNAGYARIADLFHEAWLQLRSH